MNNPDVEIEKVSHNIICRFRGGYTLVDFRLIYSSSKENLFINSYETEKGDPKLEHFSMGIIIEGE
jgi:hypothetical protein